MRFFVVNEEPERREALKILLRQIDRQAEFTELPDWTEAQRSLARGLPDLLLIDWRECGVNATELLRLLRRHPGLPVAILSDDSTPASVTALLHGGVLGVIPRNLDPRQVVRALELVILGGHYVPARALDLRPPARHPQALLAYRGVCESRARGRRPLFERACSLLSPRQQQIMGLVHMGSTNKIIARALGISEGTVKTHLCTVFKLLGATNRASALAIYNGWQFDPAKASKAADLAKPAHTVSAGRIGASSPLSVLDTLPRLTAIPRSQPYQRLDDPRRTTPAPANLPSGAGWPERSTPFVQLRVAQPTTPYGNPPDRPRDPDPPPRPRKKKPAD